MAAEISPSLRNKTAKSLAWRYGRTFYTDIFLYLILESLDPEVVSKGLHWVAGLPGSPSHQGSRSPCSPTHLHVPIVQQTCAHFGRNVSSDPVSRIACVTPVRCLQETSPTQPTCAAERGGRWISTLSERGYKFVRQCGIPESEGNDEELGRWRLAGIPRPLLRGSSEARVPPCRATRRTGILPKIRAFSRRGARPMPSSHVAFSWRLMLAARRVPESPSGDTTLSARRGLARGVRTRRGGHGRVGRGVMGRPPQLAVLRARNPSSGHVTQKQRLTRKRQPLVRPCRELCAAGLKTTSRCSRRRFARRGLTLVPAVARLETSRCYDGMTDEWSGLDNLSK